MVSELAEKFVPALAALAQPTRLQIIDVVAAAGAIGMPAGAVAKAVRCPASTLSFHLKELTQAGLLQAEPKGRFIIYSIRQPALTELSGFIGRYGAVQSRGRAGTKRKGQKGTATAKQDQLSMFGD